MPKRLPCPLLLCSLFLVSLGLTSCLSSGSFAAETTVDDSKPIVVGPSGGALNLRVLDTEGRPLAARYALHQSYIAHSYVHRGVEVLGAGVLPENGAAEIVGLPLRKTMFLEVHFDGYVSQRLKVSHLLPGEIPEFEARLRRAASVAVVVRNPNGTPLQGAKVWMVGSYPTERVPGLRFISPPYLSECDPFPQPELPRTDSAGRCLLANLVTNTYVRIAAAGAGHRQAISQRVPLRAGVESKVELVLQPGPSVAGRVVYDDGTPAAGVELFVAPTEDTGEHAIVESSSGPDGSFRLDGLPPVEVELHLRNGIWTSSEEHESTSKLPSEIVIPRVGELELLVVGSSGEPVALASVGFDQLDGDEGRDGDHTNAAGRFTWQGLLPGKYLVSAFSPGGYCEGEDDVEAELQIVAGEKHSLSLTVRTTPLPPVELRVRVKSPVGEPIPGVQLVVYELAEGVTDDNGEATIQVPRGTCRNDGFSLECTKPGWTPLWTSEAFPDGGVLELDLELNPESVLDLILVDHDGTVLEDPKVQLEEKFIWYLDPPDPPELIRLEDRYRIRELKPATWTITVEHGHFVRKREVVLPRAGHVVERFQLPGPRFPLVVDVTADGKPVCGEISVLSAHHRDFEWQHKGWIELENGQATVHLPAGNYSLGAPMGIDYRNVNISGPMHYVCEVELPIDVVGRVVTESGVAVGGEELRWYGPGEKRWCRTDETGAFHLRGVLPGKYAFHLKDPPLGLAPYGTIDLGQSKDRVVVVVGKGRRVQVTRTDVTGDNVPSWYVYKRLLGHTLLIGQGETRTLDCPVPVGDARLRARTFSWHGKPSRYGRFDCPADVGRCDAALEPFSSVWVKFDPKWHLDHPGLMYSAFADGDGADTEFEAVSPDDDWVDFQWWEPTITVVVTGPDGLRIEKRADVELGQGLTLEFP